MTDTAVTTDDDAAEAAAAALATVDSEFGRTTDPVRMYMREMGTVELLTRAGELKIAKRIEEGQAQVLTALATFPDTIVHILEKFALLKSEDIRISDVIAGFAHPEVDIPVPPPPPSANKDDDEEEEIDTVPILLRSQKKQPTSANITKQRSRPLRSTAAKTARPIRPRRN